MNRATAKRIEVSRKPPRWGPERRLEFIEFRLRWDGRLNRGDLIEFFGISVPQASLDIARYLELAPGNLIYDHSARVYVATAEFKPMFASSAPEHFLGDLLEMGRGELQPASSFIGEAPPFAVLPAAGRKVGGELLAMVLQAIQARLGLAVKLNTEGRTVPTELHITPHGLFHDGHHWRVRSWAHDAGAFRDDILTRMQDARMIDGAGPGPEADTDWQEMAQVQLVANPRLSKGQRRLVELDHGLENGVRTLSCRRCLLPHVLRHFGVDEAREDAPLVVSTRRKR